MRKFKLTLVVLYLLLQSCATYKPHNNKIKNADTSNNNSEVSHTFYLIGDAGNETKETKSETLQTLNDNLTKSDPNSTLIFLGDNIYPAGMPNKESSNRLLAEEHLDVQIKTTNNFKGKTIFIPGNHDWYSDGNEGLKREQKYIEEKLGKNSFLPKKGCPVETVNINDDIVLIIVDSQWYITNWNKYPTINEDCDIKTRVHFLEVFRAEIKKARGKTTLIAVHHPMFSNGVHGGNYSFKSHLQPFPIIGSLKNLLRRTTGISNADLQNVYYNQLKQNLVAAAQQNDKVVFISGHEHTLQYIKENNSIQIVSGSGSKISPTRTTHKDSYSNSINGFAVLEIYKNGASAVKFIDGKKNTIDFETTVLPADSKTIENNFQAVTQDSVSSTIYTKEEVSKSKFYEFLWGKRFRKYYNIPVSAKSVNLDTLFGGLTPTRKGGGTQSKALRFKAKSGKQYVIRALRKNATQYIQATIFKDQYFQPLLENTASERLVKDVFTGSYPYISLVIPKLSDAIGVAHLNPQLLYIPKQKALKEFNEEFGDELYFLEEHTSEGHLNLAGENFTGNLLDTNEMLQEIQSDNSKIIDETSYIKARLFDMLIGDWDRHQDQWRWLEFKENGKTVYRPLPRDRDQAFSRMSDGFMLGAAVRLVPMAKLLRKYESDLKNVKGFNIEPYPLDVALITQSNKQVWDEQVQLIQKNITNEIINQSFNTIPKEVNDETIQQIKKILLARKDNLQKISDRYYKVIKKLAVVKGTNKKDVVKITCLDNGSLELKITDKKSNTQTLKATYDPVFTKEIWVYGLDEEDDFEISGKSKCIKIRLIGGQNNDSYTTEFGKNIVIYDYKSKKNNVDNSKYANIKLTDDYSTNVYDFKKTKNNVNQIIPTVGVNPDDGLKIGIANTYTRFGFDRNPFTSRQKVKAAYYFATNGFEVDYSGEFANIFNKINFLFEAGLQSANFTENFFGFGNNTLNLDDDLDFDFNRVKIRKLYAKPSFKWRSNSNVEVNLGLSYENLKVQNTEDRFIKNNIQLPNYIFNHNSFFGINTNFSFENFDSKAFPTVGMKTNIAIGYKYNNQKEGGFTYIIPEVSFTNKIDNSGKLVLATKFKSHINFGTNFEFYQAATIGANDGLRGFRNQRFSGNQSFYQNTDLRFSFNTMKTNLIPIKIGLYSGFDYGRVWLKNENSNKWHNSYGGGFFVNGAEILNANIGIFNSTDGMRVSFSLGFQF